ncbi:GRB10-interacting GYF protein 2-like [Procambarus clarkii]|uniref:GRB10-interacting GYF protein 2-like n=1 Tax=Procambarus clarkii TaxID=6728 RepID=UPI003742CCFE
MFRVQAFLNDPAGEIGTLCRAKRTELQTLAHEYYLDVPHGANKNEIHNLIMDYLLKEGRIDSETHETYSIADKPDLATMKLKLELAKLERKQQQAALQMKEREATLREREQEREAALAKEALQMRKEEAAIRKEEQEREAALREREAALRKEEQERETIILRERERVQLDAKHRHLEMQREHDKQQAALAIECCQQELALETTHLTQRQQATASLPIKKKLTTSSVRSRLTPTASSTG